MAGACSIALDKIRADSRAQPRTSIITDRVSEYVEDMTRGDKFPPLVVFREDKTHWLADGFHRYHAAIGIGLKAFACEVHKGGLREAILFSCGVNAVHGVRRTNEDKRAAVKKLLTDDEWKKWSDSEIARRCMVNDKLVARIRADLNPLTSETRSDERTYRTKHGTTATMKIAAVGKSRPQAERPDPPPIPPQVKRDIDNGWISSALWEIERQIDSLPNAAKAAELFPSHHRHTFTATKLRKMADWLDQFATSWSTHGEQHGKSRSAA